MTRLSDIHNLFTQLDERERVAIIALIDAKTEIDMKQALEKLDLMTEMFKNEISALKTTVESRITALETTVDSRITALETTVDSRITALETTVDTRFAAQDAKLTAIDSRINGMESRISFLQWTMGIGFTVIATVIAVLKFWS